jgi:hypothetical protein
MSDEESSEGSCCSVNSLIATFTGRPGSDDSDLDMAACRSFSARPLELLTITQADRGLVRIREVNGRRRQS